MSKLKNKLKNSDMYIYYKRMWKYIKPYWVRALLAMIITIPIGAFDAVIAWALKPYMDVVMIEKSAQATAYIPVLIIAFTLIQSALNYIATYLNTWAGQKVSMSLKAEMYKKLLRCDAAYFDKHNSGEVLMRYSSDVAASCSGLLANLKSFTTKLFSSLSLIGVLIYNSWQLSIVAIIVLFGALYPLTTIKKKLKPLLNEAMFTGSSLLTQYNETYQGHRIISSYNLYKHQIKKFEGTQHLLFKLGIKSTQRTGIISPMMHFIVSVGIALVIWLGSQLIVSQTITPGNFVSFIAALIMLYTPIKGIGGSYNAVQAAIIASERLFEMMDKVPSILSKPQAIKLESVKKGIEYKNVDFAYVEDKPILQNINLKIKKGQTIAFVGNSGGGKTTAVNLLPRFYDVTGGSIMIDGVDIRDYELDSLRDKIAVVFQDNFLFTGTIRENIMLGNEKASAAELDAAVKGACLDEFITTLDEGLDTPIGERGALLSGGQKQRIAIARAFLKNAPIVILDEATSALDNKSEKVVQQAVDNLMKDRTVFIIAHRLSTVRNADKIVVINYGKIVEEGTHEELIAQKKSIYASLYQTQLK